jgi:hypothetical protein
MEKEGREEDVYPYVLTCGHDLKGLETYACETSGTWYHVSSLLVVLGYHV